MKIVRKIATWLAVLLVVLVVVYGLLILLTPPTRYETRVEIDRPVDVSWRVFSDIDRLGEWLQSLVSIELTGGEPEAAGSRYRLVFEEDGRTIVMDEEVLSRVMNEEISFTLSHEAFESTLVIRFEDLGERSSITTENEVSGRGLIKPLIPLLKSSFIERQRADYERLKTLIEAEPE